MAFFACVRMRRRLAAYLDRALAGKRTAAVAAHLQGCAGCRQEAARLERLKVLVQATLAVPDPDWSGFWEGVRRRIVAESPRPWREAWWPGLWRLAGGYRRLAVGGALAALILVMAAFWPRGPEEPLPVVHPTVVVNALETAQPDGNLVVFTNPEDEMTVIWVFGLDQPADQSRIQPVSFGATAS